MRRFVRLGTASLLSEPGGPFINSEKVDLRCVCVCVCECVCMCVSAKLSLLAAHERLP